MDYQSLDETTLLQLLKKDDATAFLEIYSRFHDYLYAYAFRLTDGNEQESQDILQTLFLNVWSNRHHLQLSKKLFSYLNQSVRYGFLNQKRSKSSLARYQADLRRYLQEGHATTEETLFEQELLDKLRKLAESLPGKSGQVFLLFHFDSFSHHEIAETLGISEKTVKNLLSKSTKDIRLKLGTSLALLLLLP